MKYNDYFSLALEKNKSQNRQSRNTIVGIVISLCISIVCLFMLISFEYGIKEAANKEKNVATVELNYSDVISEAITNSKKDYISNNSLIEDKVCYKEYSLDYYHQTKSFNDITYTYPEIILDDVSIERDYTYMKSDSIISYDFKDEIILDSELNYLKKNDMDVILAGTTFGDSINEIMISDLFLNQLGITDYNSIIGKELSYKYMLYNSSVYKVDSSYDYSLDNLYLFKNYKIVGVFNSNIYNCPSRYSNNSFANYKDSLNTPFFWVKESSIKESNVEVDYISSKYNYTYNVNPLEYIKSISDEGYISIPYGFNTGGYNDNRRDSYEIIQFKNVENAYSFIKSLDKYLDYKTTNAYQLYYSLDAYFVFYPFFFYSVMIISIFSIFLTLLSLLNIYRIMDYSISSNMYIFAMQRAMGASLRNIKGVYFAGLLIEYLKSIIIALIISGIASFSFTLIMNNYLSNDDFSGCIDYSISYKYYPLIAFGVILAFGVIIYLISSLLCNRIKKGALIYKLNGEAND